MKIAAVMKAMGKKYSDTIQSETCMIEKAGGIVTNDDQIQAMTQSFRIYGKSKEDMIDSYNKVIAIATSFKFDCNFCGKGGHKANDCPQCDKIKCEH
jgi:hypothetical protein